jgi:hypothetical protein
VLYQSALFDNATLMRLDYVELYQSVSLCTFFVAAVPQLSLYMRLCRIKYLCGLTKPIFAALPQNKDRRKMQFDTSLKMCF